MGKKKALYLSSKDIAGMLQSISDKTPSPTPQEVAVIQGRIQKVAPTAITKNTTKPMVHIPQEKPQADVGGKVQLPPIEIVDDQERKNKDETMNDNNKPQEKITVTGNKEIDSRLLNLMSTLVRVHGEKDKKEEKEKEKPKDTEDKTKEKAQEKADEKESKDDKSTDDNKEKPSQGLPQKLQLAIPNLLQILEKMNGKSVTKSDAKANETEKSKPKISNEAPKEIKTPDPQNKEREQTLLAAMKLVQSIGPLPKNVLNNSHIMDQLRVATEEASVALKLLNKTGLPDKKDKSSTVRDGDFTYNIQLLRDELKKQETANQEPKSNPDESNQPQVSNFLTTLQDAINAQQGQPSAATTINNRGGVAVKQSEGKPTLSEVFVHVTI